MALPKGKVAWRSNQAFALGRQLSDGKDVGHRADLIILVDGDHQSLRAEKLIADASNVGHRPAVMLLGRDWLKDVKWP